MTGFCLLSALAAVTLGLFVWTRAPRHAANLAFAWGMLWLAAADWLVLPYRRSWSSGVLARAQALGTPAIVAAVGGLPEQAGDGDMVFDDDEGLRAALVRAAASGAVGGGRP